MIKNRQKNFQLNRTLTSKDIWVQYPATPTPKNAFLFLQGGMLSNVLCVAFLAVEGHPGAGGAEPHEEEVREDYGDNLTAETGERNSSQEYCAR